MLTTQAVAVATGAFNRRLGDIARCRAVAGISRAFSHRRGEIGRIVVVIATLYPAETVLEVIETGTVGGVGLLESTSPLGVEDEMGTGDGDKGCMASSTPPAPSLTKSIIPFQVGRGNISKTVPAPGGMVPEYLLRTNVDRLLSHTPMSRLITPARTSMRP